MTDKVKRAQEFHYVCDRLLFEGVQFVVNGHAYIDEVISNEGKLIYSNIVATDKDIPLIEQALVDYLDTLVLEWDVYEEKGKIMLDITYCADVCRLYCPDKEIEPELFNNWEQYHNILGNVYAKNIQYDPKERALEIDLIYDETKKTVVREINSNHNDHKDLVVKLESFIYAKELSLGKTEKDSNKNLEMKESFEKEDRDFEI
ncbi:MAG: hypothetical protein ACK5M0_06035 [Bacteroidales bacterium]